ncbi:class II fructose-bisphosphate aldolase family protein [Acidothermaceae bacterium B102]|nr:class II fructose-bisphosphate aldolase family protein [Acidothermaceae bacterium B102]
MPLARTGDLVAAAAVAGVGVGAFNIITLEHAEAVVLGAEDLAVPVILQISENAVKFHGSRLFPIAAAAVAIARSSSVDVAVHLDHVVDEELLHQVAEAGLSSVMYDAGALPYDTNVAQTRAAVLWAHAHGLWLEAELGYVGGKPTQPQSAHAAGVRTDPDEAMEFVRFTEVDALAVAVGSSHAMRSRTASIDTELVAALRAALPVPLVLHGSSGVPDDALRAAIAAGMTKVNVGTALSIAMTAAVRETLGGDADLVDPRGYLSAARTAVAATVRHLLTVIALA